MKKKRGNATVLPFIQITHGVPRPEGEPLGRKGVFFAYLNGYAQRLIDNMMLESPLPIPSRDVLAVKFPGFFSHAKVYVIGKDTEPQFPRFSKLEKLDVGSMLIASRTAVVWALPT